MKDFKKRLTVILGAGSMLEIGFPSTDAITGKFLENAEYSKIFDEMNRKPNFEDLFFEARERKDNSVNDNDIYFYRRLITEGIHIIKKEIIEAQEKYRKKSIDYSWYKNFFSQLGSDFFLDIISLNYDGLFEVDIFREQILTGFLHTSDSKSKFVSEELMHNFHTMHRILRLHGSIHFRLPYDENVSASSSYEYNEEYDKSGNLYWDAIPTLFKYLSSHGNSSARKEELIERDKIPNTTIITGHRKADFFSTDPYRTYEVLLPEFFKNQGLLIVGFNHNPNDLHLNSKIPKDKNRIEVNFDKSKSEWTDNCFNSGFRKFAEDYMNKGFCREKFLEL